MANTGDMSVRSMNATGGMLTAEACRWRMKALENGKPADFLPNLFCIQYELDFALGFGCLFGFVVFFYHLSCKLILPVLLSDLHKHLKKNYIHFSFCYSVVQILQLFNKLKKIKRWK